MHSRVKGFSASWEPLAHPAGFPVTTLMDKDGSCPDSALLMAGSLLLSITLFEEAAH
jgi:hypothetical protein